MKILMTALLAATTGLVSTSVFAEQPPRQGDYLPPQGYNQAPPGYNPGAQGYNRPPMGYNQPPQGYDQPPRGYNQAPPAYDRRAYGPPPGYYPNRYRGAPPRGYRNNRWGRNFFDFPGGGRGNGYDGPPWDMRTFTDPERFWDDMLETPDTLPTMPGGWNVPTISVPNPVEAGREIAEEAPNMMDTARDWNY